ncbi:MAG: hypothetical protein EOM74_01465 [Methanomicrobia archaeon]|nr:hypothetical protein [Methanomicrobia archaeon]
MILDVIWSPLFIIIPIIFFILVIGAVVGIVILIIVLVNQNSKQRKLLEMKDEPALEENLASKDEIDK